MPSAPNAGRFPELPPERAWMSEGFDLQKRSAFARKLGIRVEEIRHDYCRLRLPFDPDLLQGSGVIHGGVIASLIDTSVVPAIASGFETPRRFATVDLRVQFLAAARDEDLVAEGWIVRRGGTMVFCRAEVRGRGERLVATGDLVYQVGGVRAPR